MPGITHTQFTADVENPGSETARVLLTGKGLYQNQNLMGWGAGNPQPSPGVYEWDSLDRRIELIRKTSGVPVLTLCCAPDWMKGGPAGKTDWSKLNSAPTPDHYADFAALAGQVAKRYPDVMHYQVWHGMKGFFDRKQQTWNARAYTQLYNLVYRELKAVNPQIKVGGPYVVMDSWSDPRRMAKPSKLRGAWGVVDQRSLDVFEYWLKNKQGADFISLDISTPNKDRVSAVNAFRQTEKITAVAKWVRKRSDLPLWAARWHVLPPQAKDWGLNRQAAVLTSGLVRLASSGVEVGLLWEPQGRSDQCAGCLWTDTRMPGGGQATPLMSALERFSSLFPPGTALATTRTSPATLSGLSKTGSTMLVNHQVKPQQITLNGARATLDPFEIRTFSPRPGSRGATRPKT